MLGLRGFQRGRGVAVAEEGGRAPEEGDRGEVAKSAVQIQRNARRSRPCVPDIINSAAPRCDQVLHVVFALKELKQIDNLVCVILIEIGN